MTDQSAKAPLAWGLTALAVISMGAGGGAAFAAGYGSNSLAAAFATLFVVAAAVLSVRERLWYAGVISAAATFLMLLLAYVTAGAPIAAGIAMALVTFLGAILAAGSSALGVAGLMLSLAYFLPAATSTTRGLDLARAVELGLIGVGAGLVVVGLLAAVRALRGKSPDKPAEDAAYAAANPAPLAAIASSLRQRDDIFRYALRRSVALGVAMGIFQIDSNHNVFWIMLTMFVVLGPDRASSWQKALQRSGGVIIGALVISGLAQILPVEAVVGLAIVSLLGGLLYFRRSYVVYAAGITFTVLTIFGAKDANFTGWAERRVVDTLIGATIALVVGYLVLPDRKRRDDASAAGP
jgi:hypothetical protein